MTPNNRAKKKVKAKKNVDRRYLHSSERSPYWDDFMASGRDDFDEHPQANPDVLPAEQVSAPSTPQLIMGEAIEHLQGRQREVYILTMREDKSMSEAAEILGIEKASVQVYKARAVKFIEKYCLEAIKKGRI